MALKNCQKSSLCIVSATFLFLCLSLPSVHYFSPYSNTISAGTGFFKVYNKSVDSHVEKDACLGRYIFMHDLPPRFNQELVENCRTLTKWLNFCPYLVNGGFGPRFNDTKQGSKIKVVGESWYATNQFMLSVIIHTRMKRYECLTGNSSIASAIYAPFYAGLEVGRHLWDEFNTSVKDAAALDLTTWLRGKPEWSRLFGWDHFLVAGRVTWDFRRLSDPNSKWGNQLFNLPEIRNMTTLIIESSPYDNNDFAIPYPTFFHPSKDSEVLDWQEQVRNAKRTYLFTFAGAPRPNVTGSVSIIREALISQCKNASRNRCKLLSCLAGDVICSSPANFIRTFTETSFCLQPPGDSYTRKSIFDSILSGCIPVFFHPGSAYIQYLWHLPKNYTKYSVFIPYDGIQNRTVSVEEVLSQISENDVAAMRDEVIRLIPKIIYANNKLETMEDAFDLAVKNVLERIEDHRRQIGEGKDPNSWSPENKSWKYYLTGNVSQHEWDSYL